MFSLRAWVIYFLRKQEAKVTQFLFLFTIWAHSSACLGHINYVFVYLKLLIF